MADQTSPGGGRPAGSSPGDALSLGLELVPDPCVVVGHDGRILAANRAVEVLFGYTPESLIGERIELLVPERFRHAHRQHRAAYDKAPRRRAMGSGLELYGRRHDASEFPIDISLAPVSMPDGDVVAAAIRDQTDRVAAARATSQLAAIVRSSRDAVLTMSTAGVVTTWNPSAEELLGAPAGEAIGSHIARWVPEGESPVLEELMALVIAEGYAPPRDTVWRTAGGKQVELAISLSPLQDERGALEGFSVLARDITERKLAEAARQKQQLWQAATADVRMASLSDVPFDDTLKLICVRVSELTGADGAAVVLPEGDELRIRATWGERRDDLVLELSRAVLASGKTTRSSWDLSLPSSGRPFESIGSFIASPSEEPGSLIVLLPPGVERTDEVHQVVESMAGQAAVALELFEARETKDRLLLTSDRERIARDLHDLVIQRLFATGMSLQAIQQVVSNASVSQRLSDAITELDTTIREVRTTIFALDTRGDEGDSLRRELVNLVSGADKSLGFRPSLQFDGPVDLVADELRHHAVAVVREALSNVARHARATHASVVVVARDGFTITVEDNGVGLPDQHRESGLSNLRRRAAEAQGSLTVEDRPDGGTRVTWSVPIV